MDEVGFRHKETLQGWYTVGLPTFCSQGKLRPILITIRL